MQVEDPGFLYGGAKRVPTEAYMQYAARRSDRPSSVAGYCGGWKGNTADDILMVDQGLTE